jgi:hypothetical protein
LAHHLVGVNVWWYIADDVLAAFKVRYWLGSSAAPYLGE